MKSGTEAEVNSRVNMVRECRKLLSDKKAISSVLLDLSKVHSDFDYFLITIANSQIHCRSLAREALKYFNKSGYRENNIPDFNSGWVVIDFDCIVLHFFTESTNEYYQLEKLWSDAGYIN